MNFTKKFQTRQAALDYVNGVKLNNVLVEVLEFAYEKPRFTFKDDKQNFKNLEMVNKPKKKDLEEHLVELKAEWIADVNSQFDKKELESRVEALPHYKPALTVVFGEPNWARAIRKLKTEEEFNQVKAESDRISAEIAAQNNELQNIENLNENSTTAEIVSAIKYLAGV